MLYLLPPRTLDTLRMALTETAIFLLDPSGVEGVPLGRFYAEVAERVYVPAGEASRVGVLPNLYELRDDSPPLLPVAPGEPVSLTSVALTCPDLELSDAVFMAVMVSGVLGQ